MKCEDPNRKHQTDTSRAPARKELKPMLKPAAMNPAPKKAIQNTCHGIQFGTSVPMGARARK